MTQAGWTDRDARALVEARRRVSLAFTAAMVVLYVGFILLVAFGGPVLATRLAPGLTLGILLGAGVIVSAWVLVWLYARRANRRFDPPGAPGR